MRKKTNPKALSGLLESALRSVNKIGVIHLVRIEEKWGEVVGAQLSKVSRPVKIDKSKLIIWVKEPVWLDSMTYMKARIIEKVNALFENDIIKSALITLEENPGKPQGYP